MSMSFKIQKIILVTQLLFEQWFNQNGQKSQKRVNRGHSELIFEWTRAFLDMKFGREIRKRQGFSKMTSVFHLYLPVFYKKIKTVKKKHILYTKTFDVIWFMKRWIGYPMDSCRYRSPWIPFSIVRVVRVPGFELSVQWTKN